MCLRLHEVTDGSYFTYENPHRGYAIYDMEDYYSLKELATTFRIDELCLVFSVADLKAASLIEEENHHFNFV